MFKVIKNPIQDHLPVGCKKYLTSFNAESFVDVKELVPADEPVVIVVGAMAKGKVTEEIYYSCFLTSSAPTNSVFSRLTSIIASKTLKLVHIHFQLH